MRATAARRGRQGLCCAADSARPFPPPPEATLFETLDWSAVDAETRAVTEYLYSSSINKVRLDVLLAACRLLKHTPQSLCFCHLRSTRALPIPPTLPSLQRC